MALHFSLEQMTRLREATRLLASRAADHERDLQALLTSAELDLRDGSDDQRARRTRAVRLARQMCLDAREQQIALGQLMIDLGAELAAARRLPPLVLVTDDHKDTRERLVSMLHGAGLLVQAATNGLEAVIAAHRLRPAVIVMDIRMPVLDGFAATRLIKAVDELRKVPVIAHTAEQLADWSFPVGVFAAILPKPSPPDHVLATVQRLAHEPS